MLAIILSKAMLLANDTKITDPTITRQISGNAASKHTPVQFHAWHPRGRCECRPPTTDRPRQGKLPVSRGSAD